MPSLLDNVLETHDGPEPRVVTADVQRVLRRVIDDDAGVAVAIIARRADVSTRTVYRVLNPSESKPTISLDLADKLCLAAGTHISSECNLEWPDGTRTPYHGFSWANGKVVASDGVA
jgi:DNA-binding phage protein